MMLLLKFEKYCREKIKENESNLAIHQRTVKIESFFFYITMPLTNQLWSSPEAELVSHILCYIRSFLNQAQGEMK